MPRAHSSILAIIGILSPAVAGAATYRPSLPTHFLADGPARLAASFGIVTSVFRTPEHNRAVGGVPNSYHLLGQAIDVVRRPGISHATIAAVLRKAGYSLIESLDEGDHSHFAVAPAAPNRPTKTTVVELEPPVPPPPPEPRVVADVHGQLLADLEKTDHP